VSSPGSGDEIAHQLFSRHEAVRYVAVLDGSQLTLRERAGLADASAAESDRYEELLVNPTLLTLATRRGEIDCGGLGYLVVGYGNFQQLVVPTRTGHVSVAVEHGADPLAVLRDVEELLEPSRVE
jgi:hypothetical protein